MVVVGAGSVRGGTTPVGALPGRGTVVPSFAAVRGGTDPVGRLPGSGIVEVDEVSTRGGADTPGRLPGSGTVVPSVLTVGGVTVLADLWLARGAVVMTFGTFGIGKTDSVGAFTGREGGATLLGVDVLGVSGVGGGVTMAGGLGTA
jgi:hypothetical protein